MLHAPIFFDDTESVVRLSDVFRETGFAVRVVATLREARAALLHEIPDVAVPWGVLRPADKERQLVLAVSREALRGLRQLDPP